MAEGFLHLLCAINRYILYLGNTTLFPRDDGNKKPVPGWFERQGTYCGLERPVCRWSRRQMPVQVGRLKSSIRLDQVTL